MSHQRTTIDDLLYLEKFEINGLTLKKRGHCYFLYTDIRNGVIKHISQIDPYFRIEEKAKEGFIAWDEKTDKTYYFFKNTPVKRIKQ